MRRFFLAALLLAISLPAQAEKRAFTLEDLYKLKSVKDPQISTDGNQIAYVVTSYNLSKGESDSDIYLIHADGGDVHQLTFSPEADSHPRWSPDGKSLMFVSTRKDGNQIWLLPMNGGDARQITTVSTGVSNPVWSPNGQYIAFASEVFPECGADEECNEKIKESVDNGPIQAHLADELLYRHWNFYQDGKYSHVLVIDVESGEVRDLTPGYFNSPPFSLGGESGFVFSPDSKEICYVSNHDKDQASSTNKDLWIVPLSGGEAKCITGQNKAFDGNPQYSPDGRYIAYLKQTVPDYESDRFRLAVYDRQSGRSRVLTEDFDNWVTGFQWAPDSKSIYFKTENRGHQPIYKVDLKSSKITLVIDDKTIDDFTIAPNGKWMAYIRRSVGEPREMYRATVFGENRVRLTFVNKAIEDNVDIRPAEEMWVVGDDGDSVHVFIVKPHGFDPGKKYPLVLNIHGGPQGQWTDGFRGDWQVYPGCGYVIAFPNPHGSVGYGQEFTASISGDYGGRVMEDIEKVADALAAIPWIDEKRMGAMGWSWGGYAIMWLEGHTDRFAAMAAMMGVYDLPSKFGATEELWFPKWDLKGQPWNSKDYQKFSPSNFVENFKTPCLVITGERDYRVSYTQSLQFFTALQEMNVPSRLIVFPNDGHWPSYVKSMSLYYNAHLDWFHKYLGGEPAPYDMQKMVRNQAFEKNE